MAQRVGSDQAAQQLPTGLDPRRRRRRLAHNRTPAAHGWLRPDQQGWRWTGAAKWSPHDLRHVAACWMLFDLGLDPAVVADKLGRIDHHGACHTGLHPYRATR